MNLGLSDQIVLRSHHFIHTLLEGDMKRVTSTEWRFATLCQSVAGSEIISNITQWLFMLFWITVLSYFSLVPKNKGIDAKDVFTLVFKRALVESNSNCQWLVLTVCYKGTLNHTAVAECEEPGSENVSCYCANPNKEPFLSAKNNQSLALWVQKDYLLLLNWKDSLYKILTKMVQITDDNFSH